MINVIDKLTENLFTGFNTKKEELIIKKCMELKIPCPSISGDGFYKTYNGNEESFFYKDIRIITFVTLEPKIEFFNDDKIHTISVSQHYY